MVKVTAPAKVNLTLHVTGQRADGYHLLDSLVMFANKGDRIRVTPAQETTLEIEGKMTEGVPGDDSNIMVRAARLMGVPVAMRLKKKLPNAAGLGGGSSDAAAVLKAVSKMTGQPIPGSAIDLGADVPVCLMGGTVRMRGVGDELAPVDALPALDAVLVNPMRPVSTAAVFEHMKERNNPPMPETLPHGIAAPDFIDWLATMRNDLEAPAMAAEPAIGQVFDALSVTPGCRLTRMSGSGGTCFGIYYDAETAAAAAGRLREQYPGWWVTAVKLGE